MAMEPTDVAGGPGRGRPRRGRAEPARAAARRGPRAPPARRGRALCPQGLPAREHAPRAARRGSRRRASPSSTCTPTSRRPRRARRRCRSGDEVTFHTTRAQDAIAVMDRKNVRTMVNLTGGTGRGLEKAIAAFDRAYPGRFHTCTEPIVRAASATRATRSSRPTPSSAARRAGARGLKVLKTLGLFLREQLTEGPLVKVDDRRFDPMWEACAAAPPARLHPRLRPRGVLPPDRPLQRALRRARPPPRLVLPREGLPEPSPSSWPPATACSRATRRRSFVALHVGHDAENLAFVAESLDRFPNMTVELGARIGELGRQPRASRQVLRASTRTASSSAPTPSRRPTARSTRSRSSRTSSTRSTTASSRPRTSTSTTRRRPVPPQGRWRIYGLGLPDGILKKVYHEQRRCGCWGCTS